jgi:hypothetical protein
MNTTQTVDTLFGAATFASLAGTAAFVYFVVNGVRVYFGIYRKWLPLLVSGLTVLAFHVGGSFSIWRLDQILLAVGNTFLIALTATGAQETGAHANTPIKTDQQGRSKFGWKDSWFSR